MASVLISCINQNNEASESNVLINKGSLKSGASITHEKFNNSKAKKSITKDTLPDYVKNNIEYISLLNLSFCTTELLKEIHNNKDFRLLWQSKMKKLYETYNDRLSYTTTEKEIFFFKRNVIKSKDITSNLYNSEDVDFVISSLPKKDSAIEFNDEKYQSLILLYNQADGSMFSELSGIYYTLLIVDGQKFITAINKNSDCITTYEKWLSNINKYEFVAYSDGFTPPQIINRKREYLLNLYKDNNSSLINITLKKIKEAKIRIID